LIIGRVESLDADPQSLPKLHGIVVEPIPWLNKSSDHEKNPLYGMHPRFDPFILQM
jgi:hypothetical protein